MDKVNENFYFRTKKGAKAEAEGPGGRQDWSIHNLTSDSNISLRVTVPWSLWDMVCLKSPSL
jgi:hypothetical protein